MVEETENKTETAAALAEQVQKEKNDANNAVVTESTNDAAKPAEEVSTDGNSVSELEKKIIRQIEYYFGDFNLKKDKFMQEQRALDDGWITMDVMLNFKRLKALSDDKSVIIAALKKSTSGLMEVNEDNTKIRRIRPVPEKDTTESEDNKARSVYIKGFPKDASLDQIIEFVEQFGPTESVFMRKYNKIMFKGSCFVTYCTEESAKKLLAAENLKYKDVEMKKMYQQEYHEMKAAEVKERIEEKKKKQENEKKAEESNFEITSGALLDVDGLPKSVKREELKEFFKKFSDVAWIDQENDSTKARIRFKEEGAAAKALEKARADASDGKIMFNESELTCSVVEGEEEKKHWEEVQASRRSSQCRVE